MKILRVLTISLLLAAVAGASARGQSLSQSGDSADVTPKRMDFPCTIVGQTSYLRFTVHNRENEPVAIRGYFTRLPFMAPPRGNIVIPPNGSYVDSVSFTPGLIGPAFGDLSIDFSRHDNQSIELRGFGSPSPRLEVAFDGDTTRIGERSISLGTVDVGDSSDLCFRLLNPSCQEITLTQFTVPVSGDFTLVKSPTLPLALKAGSSAMFCIRFKPRTAAVLADSIALTFFGRGPARVVMIGRGQPVPVMRASPPNLMFPDIFVGAASDSQTTVISNTSPTDIIVDSIVVTPPSLVGDYRLEHRTLPFVLRANEADRLPIRVTFAPQDVGTRRAAIRVVPRGAFESLRIGLAGNGQDPPLQIAPLKIDMDTVLAGDTVRRSDALRIRNVSGKTVNIGMPTVRGPNGVFTILDARALSLDAGDSATFSIAFTPSAAQVYNADIDLRIVAGPPAIIPIRGVGVVPRRDEVEVIPSALRFPCVPAGDTLALPFAIVNSSSRPVAIRAIRLRNDADAYAFILPALTGGDTVRQGRPYRDTIRFAPTGVRTYVTEVEFIFFSGGSVRLPLSGEGVSAPRIQPVSDTLDFQARQDSSDDVTVSLCNSSACSPLSITSISPDDTAFTLVAPPTLPARVDGGGSLDLTVRFRPDSRESYLARLDVHSPRGPATIYLRATKPLVAQPRIHIDRSDFPGTIVGKTSASIEFRLENDGDADDTIETSTWTVDGDNPGDFTVQAEQIDDVLRAGRANAVRFSATFTPSQTGPRTASIRVRHRFNGTVGDYTVQLAGNGLPWPLVTNPASVDLGDVLMGDTANVAAAFSVTNTGATPLTIESAAPEGADAAQFVIEGTTTGDLAPNGALTYNIRFVPSAVRDHAMSFRVRFAGGIESVVDIRARGVARGPHEIALTDADGQVNDTVVVDLTTSPPVIVADAATTVRIRIRTAPHELFFAGVVAEPGMTDVVTDDPDGSIVIERRASTMLVGNRLMRLRFLGLATAKPLDTITLVGAELSGNAQVGSVRNGIVRLTGCDIGHANAFGRPVVLKQAFPAPASEIIRLSYRAPLGVAPTLRIVDALGTSVRAEQLAEGTGEDQEYTVVLGSLSSGFYYLQLEASGVRSITPVIVRR